MLLSTTSGITSYRITENLGLVQGNTIQTRWVGRDIAAIIKTLIGGEIKGYTEMIGRARQEALKRMIAEARAKGAHAVVGVRFSTVSVMSSAAEVLAYGTAVKIEKK